MVTLTTERLLLRMFRQDDFEGYARMLADPEVTRYLGDGKPVARPAAWRQMAMLIGHWQLRGYGLWAVEEQGSGTLIGRIGIFNPEGWPGVEVGWMLRRESWGQGLATEGARAALAYAFTELNQPHIVSLIRPNNLASIRVAEKLGEALEDSIDMYGKQALVYGISQEKWQATAGT
jgi:RimJ/RimL family protein N-acetyltransferase